MANAFVNPLMLQWSRTRANLSEVDIAESIPVKVDKVLAWEVGEARPTFRQAQKWADIVHVPFGYLFLISAPVEAVPIPDLRTIGGHNPLAPSVDMLDTVRDVLRKQEWYGEYAREQSLEPLEFIGKFNASSKVSDVVADIRAVLEVDEPPRRQGGDEYLRLLISKADAAGILVMRSGIVGNNTHRKLDVGEFRGFAVSDKFAPVVFINVADAPAARLFTLIHELAHLWIGSSGISDGNHTNDRKEEVFCNAVAGEFLVPEKKLKRLWKVEEDWRAQIAELATKFYVSRLVIARRASDLGFMAKGDYWDFYRAELAIFRNEKGGLGNYYVNTSAKNGKRLSKAVLAEALSGRLLLRDAGRVLGVQPSKIRAFAEKVSR